VARPVSAKLGMYSNQISYSPRGFMTPVNPLYPSRFTGSENSDKYVRYGG